MASRSSGSAAAIRRWTLDYVGSAGQWRLQLGPIAVTDQDLVPAPGGTVVLWTRLDRIVGSVDVDDTGRRTTGSSD